MAQMQAIAGHDTSRAPAAIELPTLVIHGTLDQMLPVQNGRMIAGLIPDSRLEIFDGVGHLFFWERPEQLGRAGASARRRACLTRAELRIQTDDGVTLAGEDWIPPARAQADRAAARPHGDASLCGDGLAHAASARDTA